MERGVNCPPTKTASRFATAPGCPMLTKATFRNVHGRRPRIHDMELAGDLILFVDVNARLRPLQVIPVQRPHPEERRLRFLTMGGGRTGGRHRHGEPGGQT